MGVLLCYFTHQGSRLTLDREAMSRKLLAQFSKDPFVT